MKDLVKQLNESEVVSKMKIPSQFSSNHGNLEIINDRGLKGWMKTIKNAIKLVPKEAVPDVIGSYSSVKLMLNRTMLRHEKKTYGFHVTRTSVQVPIKNATEKVLKYAQEWSQWRGDDEGWEYALTINKTVKFDCCAIKKGSLKCVFINNKYKTESDMTSNKVSGNYTYNKKHGKDYNLNKSGLATVVHEFGHVFDDRKYISGSRAWTDVFWKWKFEKDVPDYVKSKEREAFAEAFANYIVFKGKDLPSYVNDYMKEIIK